MLYYIWVLHKRLVDLVSDLLHIKTLGLYKTSDPLVLATYLLSSFNTYKTPQYLSAIPQCLIYTPTIMCYKNVLLYVLVG